MEKLQFYASMSFMLYVPYSILFVQENTSKDQEINQSCKTVSLKRENCREQQPISLPARLSEIQQI